MTTEPLHGGKKRRARALPAAGFALAAVLAAVLSGSAAHAACGDGSVDPGEMCDDGNQADGDCCSSACQRPTGCFTTQRAGLILRDKGDDRDDKLFWRYYRGESTFEDWGDPTTDTSYAFCIWDDDELKFDTRVEAGGICQPRRPCWKTLGRSDAQAYRYFDKPTNAWGVQRLQLASQKPPTNAYIAIRTLGVNMPMPGPVAFDRYFNQSEAVTVQFLRADAPVCWEARFGRSLQNFHKKFRAILTPNQ